jgi:hypothetical protein
MIIQRPRKDYNGGMQKFWSFPAIALYFYIATILTNYGFISYYNIPSSFLQASLSANIIFFYEFLTSFLSLLGSFHWYVYVAAGFFLPIIVALYYLIFQYKRGWKKVFIAILTIIWLSYLGTFYTLGRLIAASQTNYIVPSNCSIGPAYAYVIPMIDGGQTILVPIDQNDKMTGGFLVKNTTELPCTFEYQEMKRVTS